MSWQHTTISSALATWNSYTTDFIGLLWPTKEHWNYLAGLQHRGLPIRHITSAVFNSADLRYSPIRCPISISISQYRKRWSGNNPSDSIERLSVYRSRSVRVAIVRSAYWSSSWSCSSCLKQTAEQRSLFVSGKLPPGVWRRRWHCPRAASCLPRGATLLLARSHPDRKSL